MSGFSEEQMDCKFGKSIRESDFLLASVYTNLNHGSFGTVPKSVLDAQIERYKEQESYPDLWFRESYYKYVNTARSKLAGLVKAPEKDLVLLENASSAVNSLLRSMQWKAGDKVIRFSTAYNMVIETIAWLHETAGVEDVNVELTYPIRDRSQIIDAFAKKLEQYAPGEIKVAVFSHISSMPTMIEPVKELTALCKGHGILVMIDGAHAPGVIDIDIPDIGCDFYLGNCHKWLFTPKGTAFMYVHPNCQTPSFPEPTVISSSGKRDYLGRFEYTGTRDYTGFTVITDGLDYLENCGGRQVVYDYNHNLLVSVLHELADVWGTMVLVDDSMLGFMGNVLVPCESQQEVDFITKELFERFKIFMVICWLPKSSFDVNVALPTSIGNGDKVFFTRLSAQIYNHRQEYQSMGKLLLELRDEFRTNNPNQ